jgi:heptosyltransferase-2
VDLTAELGLLETGAAMEFCDAIVTNDTGLMHIAAAKQRKLIALFGPTVREFGFFPPGEQSLVLEREGLYCRPCSHIGSATCPEGHFRCMQEISVDDVYATVNRLLS